MKTTEKKLATGPAAAAAHKIARFSSRLLWAPSLRVTRRLIFAFLISVIFNPCTSLLAEDKNWTAVGDGSDWFDDANWMPAAAPTASDDVMIDLTSASVSLPQAFEAKSLVLGGKRTSSLTISNFAAGTVDPGNASDIAVANRRDGHLILKGSAGKVTLRGAYNDSETVIPDEPSFMFYAE